MSLNYYYTDSSGHHCSVPPDCVTLHSDGLWYDKDGHQCHQQADGIVEGTAGNDVIDYGYTGDPDGDKIDHNDQVLPGAAQNDDLVYAYGGNDKVLAGEGNDKVYGGDGNDTISGGAGHNLLVGEAGDDRFLGGSGADTFFGGMGQDNLDYTHSAAAVTVNLSTFEIHGGDASGDEIGAGIDGVHGSAFNDSLVGFDQQGTDAADTFTNQFYGNDGDDTLRGLGGDDQLYGGANNDLLDADEGNDTLDGGTGDDALEGDEGDDTITGGDGRDCVEGGSGNDIIDSSSGDLSQRPDIGYPGLYAADSDVNNDKDTISGGSGDDSIKSGDDADSIHGDDGNDTIDAGVDNDTIFGGSGDDSIIGAEGSDNIDGGTGNDVIYGGYGPGVPEGVNIPDDTDLAPDNGQDLVHGGDGDDTIFGKDDDDTLYGDAGNDSISGDIDEDMLYGGDGNDTLDGGQGADSLFGGAGDDVVTGGEGDDALHAEDGNDTLSGGAGDDDLYGGTGHDSLTGGDDRDSFFGGTAGDAVDGNEGGDDHDTLNLTGAGPLHVIYDPANAENGTVEFLDAVDHHVTGTMTFKNIENVIPCFTPGTLIATPRGEVPVESLREGDRIITRDNGMQEIRWMGRRDLSWADLTAAPHLKPVLVRQGSLGNGLPERDMMVSPNHRLLVANDRTALYFDEHEVLVAAKHLITSKGVQSVDAAQVSYIHFMCDRHEVVLSNGAWTESFQPGDMTLKGMGNAQRSEIFELFPELKTQAGLENYTAARKTLKKHEAALLVR